MLLKQELPDKQITPLRVTSPIAEASPKEFWKQKGKTKGRPKSSTSVVAIEQPQQGKY